VLRQIFLNRFLLLFLSLGLGLSAFSQKVLLASAEGETILTLISPGAVIKFQYVGYSGQVQEFKGRIVSISDDSLFMEEVKLRHPAKFQLAVKDILGFRGYSTARTLSKSLLELGLVGGNLIFYYAVVAPASIAAGPAILISLGTGLLSYTIIRALYPEKIKKTTANGWSFKVITRSSK